MFALGVDRQRLHPLVGIADDVVRVHRDQVLPALRRRVESKQPLHLLGLGAAVLGDPDDAVPVDVDLVDAVLRVRQDVVRERAGAGIQLHQPVGVAAVRQPHVAVPVEPHVLADAAPDEVARQTGELRRVDALARWVLRQVVLDVHRLAERFFVHRHLLLDPDAARRRVGSEVLGQIGEQGLAVRQREAPLRVAVGDDAVAVGEGRPVGQRLPEHLVDGRLPRRRAGRSGRQEVPAVARHAGAFGDIPAGPWWIQLVVGQVLRCGARGGQLTAAAGGGRVRCAARRPQRQLQAGAVARVQRQLLHVRRESGRAGRDFVAAGEQRHGPKPAGLRVDHVQHPPVHVPDVDPRGREWRIR